MFIDPEIEAILADFPVDFSILTDEMLPAIRDALGQMPPPELSDRVERNDHVIPGSAEGPDLLVRVHSPRGEDANRGCLVWMHGGGLILGSRDMDDARFDRWCVDFDLVGVSVEYRLAPETPYPGPLDDCYRALSWVHQNASTLGVDTESVGVGGISAGGGLAAALALLTRDRGEWPIAYQLLIYPMLDDRQQTPSSQWAAPIWPAAANAYGWGAYLGAEKGTENVPQYAAPARATDARGLPPTFIAVGGADGFIDENIEFAQLLNHAGVPTDLHVYPGATHGFDALAPGATVSQRALSDIADWLSTR